jgi:hypothetical protein
MHKLFLETLRHREQDVVRYLAILGPALGGFVWLLNLGTGVVVVFIAGTVGVLLLLLLGAFYSLALGYNFRYIILEVAKLEALLKIRDAMLVGWPRSRKDFLDRYNWHGIPWCTPPEIIKGFWWAFLVGIIGVAVTACIYKPDTLVRQVVIPTGAVCLLVGGLLPIWFGRKLRMICEKEPETWDTSSGGGLPPKGDEEQDR